MPIGFVLSLIFALGRVSKNKFISKPIATYIFVIRGTPLLVQIYLIYFGLGSIEFIRESFLWYLLRALERGDPNQHDKDNFTHQCKVAYKGFAHFVAFHYALSQRKDTPYWKENFNQVISIYGDRKSTHIR